MRNRWMVCFLFGALAWGQGKPAAPPPATPSAVAPDDDDKPVPPPASAAKIAPDTAVMTIKGLCPKDKTKPVELFNASCQTVITREEFEKVARAIQPSLSPVVKKQLLANYPRLLIMSREAEARGLDQEEYFQQMFEFARKQILSQQLTRRIQDEAAKIPEKEIVDFYEKNPETFREYTLERVFVPKAKQEPPPPQKLSDEAEKDRQKNAELDMTKLADSLRARAADGEPFAALQKEAYQVGGLKSNPPNASMGKMRRTGLPPGHEAAFALKPGEVSQPVNDAGGHYIYKLDSTDMETLADAHGEIHSLLQSQRLHQMLDKIQGPFTTEVNDDYFATGPVPGQSAGGGAGPSAMSVAAHP